MSDKTLPKCPYCGADMILDGLGMVYCYECENCGASAPWDDTPEKAYEKAIRRPLQKPLTLEESIVKDRVVWLEHRELYGSTPCACVLSDTSQVVHIFRLGNALAGFVTVRKYGETWRCWATKPTDEERAAAKWEDS